VFYLLIAHIRLSLHDDIKLLALSCRNFINKHTIYSAVLVHGAVVERRTRDRKVASLTSGHGAIVSTRSTQPSIPPG